MEAEENSEMAYCGITHISYKLKTCIQVFATLYGLIAPSWLQIRYIRLLGQSAANENISNNLFST